MASNRYVRRFSRTERAIHWVHASAFLVMLGSGLVLWLPPWWAAGRLPAACATPFFRLLVAAGGALVGWLGVVNLLGRQLEDSLAAAWIWLALNAGAAAWLLWRRRDELSPRGLAATWRTWSVGKNSKARSCSEVRSTL